MPTPFSLITSSQLFAFNYITRQWRLRSEPAHIYPGRWWSLESQTYFGPLFTHPIWAPSIFSSCDSATPIFGHLPFAGCYSPNSSLRTVNISVGRRACDSIPDTSLFSNLCSSSTSQSFPSQRFNFRNFRDDRNFCTSLKWTLHIFKTTTRRLLLTNPDRSLRYLIYFYFAILSVERWST